MTTDLPLISIVTPSFNQGKFLRETLESLVAQDYPRLEVIIQDGGSTDDSAAIAQDFAQRWPGVFKLTVEQDRGQAHALNLGFARTRGEILGFLNSDDTLYPGCLHSVARALDPALGRDIVFGRSLFTGEGAPYVGVEHPAEYHGHFAQLAIWKRGYNTLPQPSVFWRRRVWEACGGFDEGEGHAVDYDLFCRFSARFPFHKVDELWSTYRLHADSKSAQKSEAEVLTLSIAVSRKHWGSWRRSLRWRCEVSHWLHDRHLHERARHHARRAEQAFAEKRPGVAVAEFTRTLACSPSMAWQRLLQPVLAGRALHWLEKLFWRRDGREGGEFTGRHADGWIGSLYRQTVEAPAGAQRLRLRLQHNPQGDHHRKIRLEARLDGRVRQTRTVAEGGTFEIEIDLAPCRGKPGVVELRTAPYFVPSALHDGSADHRRLTVLLLEAEVE